MDLAKLSKTADTLRAAGDAFNAALKAAKDEGLRADVTLSHAPPQPGSQMPGIMPVDKINLSVSLPL